MDLHGSGLDLTPSRASAQGARADLPDDIDIIGVQTAKNIFFLQIASTSEALCVSYRLRE